MKPFKLLTSAPTDTAIMRFMKWGLLTGIAGIGLLATAETASALPVVTIDAVYNWASEPSTPPVSPFTLLPLGNDTVGINQVQTTAGFNLDGVAIGFSGGNPTSGEYAGTGSGFSSAFGGNNGNTDYLDAGGLNNAVPGTVTVSYTTPQTALDLLWGTVDPDTGRNTLSITVDGYTVTGSEIIADALAQGFGVIGGGADDMYVAITGLGSFNTATFTDASTGSFEFVPGLGSSPPPQVPEPASLAIFGAALFGLGVVGVRRRRKHAA